MARALWLAGLVWSLWVGDVFAGRQEAVRLSALARQAWPDLTDLEVRLAESAAAGEVLHAPRDEAAPSAETTIRATVLHWLCTEPSAVALLSHLGVAVEGATIVGRVELPYAELKTPLALTNCQIPGGLNLSNAHLLELSLNGSTVGDLQLDHARIDRSVWLANGFQSLGEVRLHFTRIGGNLDATDARFDHPHPDALFADGARIDGDVLLRYGTRSRQRISLARARIQGDVDAEHSHLQHPQQGEALNLDGATIAGDLRLNDANVEGMLVLYGTSIGGSLEAERARLLCLDQVAIRGYGVEVGQNAWFVDATLAGDVQLESAQIGRDLNFADVSLSSYGSPVLVGLTGASVGRRFRWTGIKSTSDQGFDLDLRSMQVNILQDETPSWPGAGLLQLHGFEYDKLHDDSPSDTASRIEWLRRQPKNRFRPQPYEQLARVFRENGLESAAREVLIAKERDRVAGQRLSLGGWAWYRFFGPMIGYGYEPWQALFLIFFEVLFGAMIFQAGYLVGWMTRTKEVEHVRETGESHLIISPDYPRFNALIYSLDVFTPLTYLHQADYWMPNPARGPRLGWGTGGFYLSEILRIYYWFHIIAGWTLTSLFVAGLSGLVEQH